MPQASENSPFIATSQQRLSPHLWLLDPNVVHLNHGSFGAVPVPVLDAQRRALESIERSPEQFYRADLAPAIDVVRKRVAEFLCVHEDSLALVQNATEAMQVAIDAVRLQEGSEIIYTDHAYGWVKSAIQRVCEDRGAVARCIPLPDTTRPDFTEALVSSLKDALSDRTALLVIDQITSASALRLPAEEVCAELGPLVPILVDAAHAPGLIDNPVPDGASFWLGNLHKWAFAARTAAALVVAPQWRAKVRPLVASAGAADGFPRSFSYLGTQDPTAYLALPTSLAFPEEHFGLSFHQLRERNIEVLDTGLQALTAALGLSSPPSNGLPMRVVPLGRQGTDSDAWKLTNALRADGIEVAITAVGGLLTARVSVQAYVAPEDFTRLAEALRPWV